MSLANLNKANKWRCRQFSAAAAPTPLNKISVNMVRHIRKFEANARLEQKKASICRPIDMLTLIPQWIPKKLLRTWKESEDGHGSGLRKLSLQPRRIVEPLTTQNRYLEKIWFWPVKGCSAVALYKDKTPKWETGQGRLCTEPTQRTIERAWIGQAESLCYDRLVLCWDSVPAPFDRCHAIPEW
jgi:hypothetical protein